MKADLFEAGPPAPVVTPLMLSRRLIAAMDRNGEDEIDADLAVQALIWVLAALAVAGWPEGQTLEHVEDHLCGKVCLALGLMHEQERGEGSQTPA